MTSSASSHEGENCPICFSIFEKESAVSKLKCEHIFCQKCLIEWKERSDKCPLCRKTIEEKAIIGLNPTNIQLELDPEYFVVKKVQRGPLGMEETSYKDVLSLEEEVKKFHNVVSLHNKSYPYFQLCLKTKKADSMFFSEFGHLEIFLHVEKENSWKKFKVNNPKGCIGIHEYNAFLAGTISYINKMYPNCKIVIDPLLFNPDCFWKSKW